MSYVDSFDPVKYEMLSKRDHKIAPKLIWIFVQLSERISVCRSMHHSKGKIVWTWKWLVFCTLYWNFCEIFGGKPSFTRNVKCWNCMKPTHHLTLHIEQFTKMHANYWKTDATMVECETNCLKVSLAKWITKSNLRENE